MFDNLFGSDVTNLSNSLKRTSERYGLIAGNLANVNTPGYKRKDIDFAIQLEDASSKDGFGLKGGSVTTSQGAMRRDGSSVNLEQEVTALAETEARYKILTDLTSRYFSGLKSIIREGR